MKLTYTSETVSTYRRLLCVSSVPSSFFNNDSFIVKDTYGILHFSGYKKTIYYNSSNNLPIFFTAPKFTTPPCHTLSKELSSTTAALLSSEDLHTDTINLSAPQRKLLLHHYQLGHLHMARIQSLAREGLLCPNNADIASCDALLCKACIHGKQHRCPISSASTGPLDSNHLKPGDCVSCDQLESTSPGLIPVYKGTPTNSSYHAGTLFIDHASCYLYFTPHISTGAIEAVQAKQDFKFHASSPSKDTTPTTVSSTVNFLKTPVHRKNSTSTFAA
jgi:hypothetical protein